MKKKLIKIGLALTAVMIALGLAGCPGPNDEPGPSGDQDGAELSWLNVDVESPDLMGAAWFGRDDWAANADAVLADSFVGAAELKLAGANATKKLVFELNSNSNKATVEFAVKKSDAALSGFSADPEGRTFEDGDILVIKVTSENRANTRFYRADISLGTNAELAYVMIGSTEQTGEAWLGKPAAAWNDIETGAFQTDAITPTTQFKAAAQDAGATVEYALRDESTTPGTDVPADAAFTELPPDGISWSSISSAVKGDDTYLYFKVTPVSNKASPLYYRMSLVFPASTTIKYGVPQLVDPANPGAAFYIDPIWNQEEWAFDISRANQAESVGSYFKQSYGRHTTAKAKALWDDDGIWVLLDVDFHRFSETATGAQKDRALGNQGTEHNIDSLEIFVNERLQILATSSTANLGNQFRVGANNDRTGSAGDTSSLVPFTEANYAKTRVVWKKPTPPGGYADTADEATNGGYMVIAYVPFKFKASADANAVFENNKVKDNADIGFELQLNVMGNGVAGGRDGILTWNGVNSQAYQNARGFGRITLDRAGRAEATPPETPSITAASLANASYPADTPAADVVELSVTVAPPASGTLSYQWFKAASAAGAGTPVGTGNTYKPVIGSTLGDEYYYVIITNTRGADTTSVSSARARIRTQGETSNEVVVNNPEVTVNGGATKAADGTVTLDGTYALVGYEFPDGNWATVTFEIETTITAGTPKMISKNAVMANTPDCTTNQYFDLIDGTLELTYPITSEAGLSGNQAALYNGAITWQYNTWQNEGGAGTFKVTKATFTAAAEVWPTDWVEKVTTVVTNAPVYGFKLPSGKKAADYDRLVMKIKTDAAVTGRLRAWGLFELEAFTDTARPGMSNAAGTGLLTNPGIDNFSQDGDWTEYVLPLNNTASASLWNGNATTFGIAFGVIPPGGGSGNREYYIKDIELSNTDGTEKVPALHPKHSAWDGHGEGAYVTQDAADVPRRELQ